MKNDRSHPILQQLPLTVSPFISLPSAPTLSYNYRPMPSALPPSVIAPPTSSSATPDGKPKYVVSRSGQTYHPSEILASCYELKAHVTRLQEDAERDLREFEERAKERELAEKRKVAPGWLDSDSKMLEPERVGGPAREEAKVVEPPAASIPVGMSEMAADEGAQLDKAFGGLNVK